jgi:hypothetical protein
MPPEVKKEEAVTEPSPAQTATPEKKEDLFSMISKAEPVEQKPAAQTESEILAEAKKELDGITDPAHKKILEDKIKNLERGYNQKYMQLAEERKRLEAERQSLNSVWTPERLKAELSKQDFLEAAKMLVPETAPPESGISQEQWNFLTTEERAELMKPITELKKKVDSLEAQNQMAMQATMRNKIDTELKAKWADYDPLKVDTFFEKVQNRQVPDEQLFELAWKGLNFERYVERAHKLGLDGRTKDIQEKVNSTSYPGAGHAAPQEEPPKRNDGETSPSYFKRLSDWRRQKSTAG